MSTRYRVGVDIGGTFTDIVLLGADGTIHTKKISSSVGDYARAIVDGLERAVRRDRAWPAAAIEEIRHGTTVASNAILEHKGARVGLITTKGFRDVLEIRTLRMPRLYDLAWEKPRAAGRALSAPGRRRAGRCARPHRAARSIRATPSARSMRCWPRRSRRSPSACSTPSPIRAHELMLKEIVERKAPALKLSVSLRGAARDQGVRAHLDDGDQRLCHADRRELPARAAAGPRRGGHPGARCC